MWLTMLRVTPDRPSLRDDTRRVLARWPHDPQLVIGAADALIRSAERLPPDQPPAPDGPADQAVVALEACLQHLGSQALSDPQVGGYLQMALGNALRLRRSFEEAQAAMERALALDAEQGGWWFNLGLVHKARHEWAAGLAANERARELLGDEKPVLWNTAICATALGQGEVAVEAYRAMGMPAALSDSGMPWVDGLPPAQLRVATLGTGHGGSALPDKSVGLELLWVSPLSPCHGVVQSPTFRKASVDYGDLVLWDGTPVGFGEHEGQPVPRFPLLALLNPGDERRFRFVALQQQPGDVERFAEQLPQQAQLFALQERVEMMCARCASGDHMRKHAHQPPEPHHLVYGKLIVPAAASLQELREGLEARLAKHPAVQLVVPELYEALGDSPAAGKAHQMWRGLERTGEKRLS